MKKPNIIKKPSIITTDSTGTEVRAGQLIPQEGIGGA